MSKPQAKIIGANGNIFNILSIASCALNDKQKSEEMLQRVMACESYDDALVIIMEYVDPINADPTLEQV